MPRKYSMIPLSENLFVFVVAEKSKKVQKQHERAQWEEVMKARNKGTWTAKNLVARVSTGQNPFDFCVSSEVDSLARCTPATDTQLLSVPVPIIPPGVTAVGLIGYNGLEKIGKGGFGEVFKGLSYSNDVLDNTKRKTSHYALKRALPRIDCATNINEHLLKQIHRLESLQREAQVYFSPAFNAGTCQHLALLYDVAEVRNSHGNMEPLLVLQWADSSTSTLKAWLQAHSDKDDFSTLQHRLSFAVQMCAGLQELHHGSDMASSTGMTRSSFVHHDLKPANMLLFGGDKGGPIRLLLTDFGMTVRCHMGKNPGGTPTYMAPEQWLGQPATTPARDMWATGLVLAQLFGGSRTQKTYRRYCEVATNVSNARGPLAFVNDLCALASKLATEMAVDANRLDTRDEHTRVLPKNIWATYFVQRNMCKILRSCFAFDSDSTGCAGARRPSSIECKSRLITLWNQVLDPSHNWSTHYTALPKLEASPIAENLSAAERLGNFHRLVEARLLRLLLRRCDDLVESARERTSDKVVIKCVQDRVMPHKHTLRKKLVDALESAHQNFACALNVAKTPVCVQCGWRDRGNEESAESTSILPNHDGKTLHECETCHAVRFCSAQCEASYRQSDTGSWHYTGGGCQFLSSWRQNGWPTVGLAQATEMVLLEGEKWDAMDTVPDAEKNRVLTEFVRMQEAWERVYITGPSGTWKEKHQHGVGVGVSKTSDADTNLYSPMMQACFRGLLSLVRALLDAPEDVVGPLQRWVNHIGPKYGVNPLFVASQVGHADIVSLLLHKSGDVVDVNQGTTDDGSTALITACEFGHIRVVSHLLDTIVDVNQATTDNGRTPLYMACQNGHTEVVALLLEKRRGRIDVNQALTDKGVTPLFIASQDGRADIVALLLDKARDTVDVNQATTDYGCTPLYSACFKGRTKVVEMLLCNKTRNEIDVNRATVDNGLTPLFIASQEGRTEIVSLLLDKAKDTINVNQTLLNDRLTLYPPSYGVGIYKRTPLFMACQQGHSDVVTLLLDKARTTINLNYIYLFALFRLATWIGFAAVWRWALQDVAPPKIWITSCVYLCVIFHHPADVLVGSVLSRVFVRYARSVLARIVSRIRQVLHH